jgi:hypothetical protein
VNAELEYRQATIDYPAGFLWVLHKTDGLGNKLENACYVCITARFHGLRDEYCTTPSFPLPKISEEALDYMHYFVQVFQSGYLAGKGASGYLAGKVEDGA